MKEKKGFIADFFLVASIAGIVQLLVRFFPFSYQIACFVVAFTYFFIFIGLFVMHYAQIIERRQK